MLQATSRRVRSAERNEAVTNGQHYRLDAVLRLQLLHRFVQVPLDRALGDVDCPTDFGSRQTIRDKRQNLLLSRREPWRRMLWRRIWGWSAVPLNMIITCEADGLKDRFVFVQMVTIRMFASHHHHAD